MENMFYEILFDHNSRAIQERPAVLAYYFYGNSKGQRINPLFGRTGYDKRFFSSL